MAVNIIAFKEVGPAIDAEKVIELSKVKPVLEEGIIQGTIDILDVFLAIFGQILSANYL